MYTLCKCLPPSGFSDCTCTHRTVDGLCLQIGLFEYLFYLSRWYEIMISDLETTITHLDYYPYGWGKMRTQARGSGPTIYAQTHGDVLTPPL